MHFYSCGILEQYTIQYNTKLKLFRAAIVTGSVAACFYWRELMNKCHLDLQP
jgi:hypothetical protein